MDQLSGYELVDILATYSIDTDQNLMNFLAVFAAHLIAAYMLVGKFGRSSLMWLTVLHNPVILIIGTPRYSFISPTNDLMNELTAQMTGISKTVSATIILLGDSRAFLKISNVAGQLFACLGSIILAFHHGNRHVEQSSI
jgi:hypothetical protein